MCFRPQFVFTFPRPCTLLWWYSSAAKDDSNTAGGAQSLQRMDSAPAFFFALQTLGQSLQDNDNNKRPLGQSYSDDGSKVWNWDSLDEKLSFLFFPFFFSSFFFLLSSYPNVCFVVRFSQQGFIMNFHKIRKNFYRHLMANLVLVSWTIWHWNFTILVGDT